MRTFNIHRQKILSTPTNQTMKKYRTRWQEIELVEIEKETESCVWIKGRKSLKRSTFESYHDTEYDAKGFIIGEAEDNLTAAERSVEYCKQKLEKAKAAKVK